MRNTGLEEAQAGIKIAGRNINNLRYADDTTLMAESEKELKSLLMKVKKEREKTGLELNIEKTKIMASGSITSWQLNGEKMETVADFIFLGSKITVDSDWSHEIKRHLFLGRKAMTNLGSVLKSRDITLSMTVCAALNRPANLENSAVATGLEKVSVHSNPKERQCQRMLKLLHNCTHLTH